MIKTYEDAMRTEKEMFDLILGYARKDERIRAVTLEGSRTNPNVAKDVFQDYDISYFVTDFDSFIQDEHWIDVFGDLIIMQKPEAMSLFPPELNGWFSYLMLFTDGNRIDITLIPLKDIDFYIKNDKLIQLLLDKDGLFPPLPPSSDIDYHVKRPSKEFFADCCNEFWWVCTYVAKGLWRKELLYASDHMNKYVRPNLLRMLEWKVGIITNFSLSVGKSEKYLSRYLTKEEYCLLLKTYKNDTPINCRESLFAMINLFRETSRFVADSLSYTYPEDEDNNVTAYLYQVINSSDLDFI